MINKIKDSFILDISYVCTLSKRSELVVKKYLYIISFEK